MPARIGGDPDLPDAFWADRGKAETIDWFMRGGSGPPRPRFPAPQIDGKPLDPVGREAARGAQAAAREVVASPGTAC